jgi:hypothetical protein
MNAEAKPISEGNCKTAKQKMADMLARVRMKEAAAIARCQHPAPLAELPAAQVEAEVDEPPMKVARCELHPISHGLAEKEVDEPPAKIRRRFRFKQPG